MKNTAPRYNHWSKFQDRKSNTVESQRMEELKTNFRTKLGILNKNKVLYIKKNSTKNSEKTQWEKRNKKKKGKRKKRQYWSQDVCELHIFVIICNVI